MVDYRLLRDSCQKVVPGVGPDDCAADLFRPDPMIAFPEGVCARSRALACGELGTR